MKAEGLSYLCFLNWVNDPELLPGQWGGREDMCPGHNVVMKGGPQGTCSCSFLQLSYKQEWWTLSLLSKKTAVYVRQDHVLQSSQLLKGGFCSVLPSISAFYGWKRAGNPENTLLSQYRCSTSCTPTLPYHNVRPLACSFHQPIPFYWCSSSACPGEKTAVSPVQTNREPSHVNTPSGRQHRVNAAGKLFKLRLGIDG